MRINISPGKLGQNDLVIDDGGGFPLPPPIDINDLFELETFELSVNQVRPFEPVTIRWSIILKDNSINMADYRFRLKIVGSSKTLEDDMRSSGSIVHHPIKQVLYRVTAEVRGRGSGNTLGEMLMIQVDDSNCTSVFLPKDIFHNFANSEFEKIINDIKELKRRKVVVSVNPPQTKDAEIETTFVSNTDTIKLFFPFEIDINNFFNADFDVNLDILVDVDHEELESFLDVNIHISSEVDFDTFEDIVSLGHSSTVARTANKILPMVMECRKAGIERAILNGLMSYLSLVSDLENNRLLNVNVEDDQIIFVLCPSPIGILLPVERPVLVNRN